MLEGRDFVLHYQPVVDMLSAAPGAGRPPEEARMVGVEALIRLQDQVEGLIQPAEFLALAEGSGLIDSMGDWVIEEVGRRSRAWSGAGLKLDVAFNLSLRQFWQPELADKVRAGLAATGADPESLLAEVSEAAAMADPERTDRIFAELRSTGLRVGIDEFGTGQSSLVQLRDMPVQLVKIDRSLIGRLPGDPEAARTVTSIIQRVDDLGVRPVAVGIETVDQLAFLLEHGCVLGQGYLFSRPVPVEEIASMAARTGASSGEPAP